MFQGHGPRNFKDVPKCFSGFQGVLGRSRDFKGFEEHFSGVPIGIRGSQWQFKDVPGVLGAFHLDSGTFQSDPLGFRRFQVCPTKLQGSSREICGVPVGFRGFLGRFREFQRYTR